MTRQYLDLGGSDWQFGRVARCAFTADANDLAQVAEWLPATVPGNVRTDLLALQLIPDPFFGEGYKDSLWVEDLDWWYRRELQATPLLAGQRAFLVFEGIDYLSAIFVDGQEQARHEGMFSRQIVEVSRALRSGRAEVAVRLWGSSALPRRQLNWLQQGWQAVAHLLYPAWTGVYPDRSATLKCQMSFGWDFAPPVRTMGIWDEASLVFTGPVFIRAASVIGRPETVTATTSAPASLAIHLELDASRPTRATVMVQVSPANFSGPAEGPFYFTLDLPGGMSEQRLELRLADMALWFPWDRGQPNLYLVTLTLLDPAGQRLDEKTVRTGLRAVERRDWQFFINGRAEFMRGLNWVPADSFPGRLRPDHYAHLLELTRAGGANLLRVWGGGLREKRAFYDRCDELGLLVWQEFPFACMFLGSFPGRPGYLALVRSECSAIVRQLRHHPALLLWCGGNEFSQRRNRPLLQTLAGVVQAHDGTRPFVPVSPSFAKQGGDRHQWHVWHGYAPLQAYQTETAAFLSEFGLQALPHLETLAACLPDPGTGWASHHADLAKLQRYMRPFLAAGHAPLYPPVMDVKKLNRQSEHRDSQRSHRDSQSNLCESLRVLCAALCNFLPNHFLKPHNGRAKGGSNLRTLAKYASTDETHFINASLQAQVTASQRAQAAGLQLGIEQMRRRKNEAGGVCVWQFNEPWPAISWAIVDYFGRPKLAYERLRQWYRPLLLCLKFPAGRCWQAGQLFQAEIWAINDGDQAVTGELRISLDEAAVHTQALSVAANTLGQVGVLAHRLPARLRSIRLALHCEGEILAENFYDLDWCDPARGSFWRRLRRWVAEWVLW